MAQLDTLLEKQRHAADALVRFCDLHGVRDPGIEHVRACREALQAGDIVAAVSSYKLVPLGGNGCFNDWQPGDIPDHEHVLATFRALVERWSRVMHLSVDAPNNSFKPKPLRGSA